MIQFSFYLTGSRDRDYGVLGGYFAKPEQVFKVQCSLLDDGQLSILISLLQGNPEPHAITHQAVSEATRWLHDNHKDAPLCGVDVTIRN